MNIKPQQNVNDKIFTHRRPTRLHGGIDPLQPVWPDGRPHVTSDFADSALSKQWVHNHTKSRVLILFLHDSHGTMNIFFFFFSGGIGLGAFGLLASHNSVYNIWERKLYYMSVLYKIMSMMIRASKKSYSIQCSWTSRLYSRKLSLF